jgi:hypothetical protein
MSSKLSGNLETRQELRAEKSMTSKNIMSYEAYVEYMQNDQKIHKVWHRREKLAFIVGFALGVTSMLVITSFLAKINGL